VYWSEPAHAGESGDRAFCVTELAGLMEYRARDAFAPSDPDQGCPAGGGTL
jgi:hypothetical protein